MTGRKLTIAILLIIAACAISISLYPHLPASIPTHWNLQGQADGYSSKQFGAALLPLMMLLTLALSWLLPWLSPRRFEIDPFRSTFEFIIILLIALFGYLHFVILWSACRGGWDGSRLAIGGVMVLFVLLGNVLGKVRRNFWIGIRTPWTLADERVWNDTHRMGGKVFAAAGAFGLFAVLFGAPSLIPLLMILAAASIPAIYSLVRYKALQRDRGA